MKMEQTLICTDNFPFDGFGLGRIGAEGTRKIVISVGETMIIHVLLSGRSQHCPPSVTAGGLMKADRAAQP
uniref:Uncharacterized protein n=1 Tax=Rhizobium rhizogenes TaxID=359 RepID=A0A2Z2PN66_RHIRH|nr:hypothetical protein [Rhizobium rhizogenes]